MAVRRGAAVPESIALAASQRLDSRITSKGGGSTMASAAYETIKRAIQNKQVIAANYHAHHREMCPHTLGHTDGREKALLYQFAGGSDTGLGPDCCCRCKTDPGSPIEN